LWAPSFLTSFLFPFIPFDTYFCTFCKHLPSFLPSLFLPPFYLLHFLLTYIYLLLYIIIIFCYFTFLTCALLFLHIFALFPP
jgi:hypothetical protein